MSDFLAKSEPIRRYLYGLAAPVLGLLVFKGVIGQEEAEYYLLIGGAALVVPVGVELARQHTTPLVGRD